MKAVIAEIAEHFGYEQQKNMLAEKVKRTRSIIDQALKASTYGGTHE